jgi:hypothetical protein
MCCAPLPSDSALMVGAWEMKRHVTCCKQSALALATPDICFSAWVPGYLPA